MVTDFWVGFIAGGLFMSIVMVIIYFILRTWQLNQIQADLMQD